MQKGLDPWWTQVQGNMHTADQGSARSTVWHCHGASSPKAGPWHVLNAEMLGCLYNSVMSGGGSMMVGCSSRLLAVLLLPAVAAEPLASTMCCALLLLLRLLRPRTACAPDRSKLSSCVVKPLTPAWLEKHEPISELTASGTACDAANALPAEAPAAELRSLLLLLALPPALLRPLRSLAAPADAPSMCAAHAGSGSSELPVAAVLKGLTAAAANGLDVFPLALRDGPGLALPCRLLLLLRPDPGLQDPSAGASACCCPCTSCCCVHTALQSGCAAAPVLGLSALSPPAGGGDRSIMTTVMLSRLPLSTAAFVKTVAATRAAALRDAPFSRARLMDLRAKSVASWLLSTSHSPSLASSSSSSRA
jgi:hypothetical protein